MIVYAVMRGLRPESAQLIGLYQTKTSAMKRMTTVNVRFPYGVRAEIVEIEVLP